MDSVLGEVLDGCFRSFELFACNVCIGEDPNMTVSFGAFRDALDAETECGKNLRSSIWLSNGEERLACVGRVWGVPIDEQ